MREDIQRVATEIEEFKYGEESTFISHFVCFGLSEVCKKNQKENFFKRN